jgi:AhpD family alkylhydroperoxidase
MEGNLSMKNYPEHLRNIQGTMGELRREDPEIMKAFMGLHKVAAEDGVLSSKVKELIALAIAVNVRCNGCIAFHVNDALKAGAKRDEIIEALGVAILMGGGPAMMYAVEALDALNQFEAEMTPA